MGFDGINEFEIRLDGIDECKTRHDGIDELKITLDCSMQKQGMMMEEDGTTSKFLVEGRGAKRTQMIRGLSVAVTGLCFLFR